MLYHWKVPCDLFFFFNFLPSVLTNTTVLVGFVVDQVALKQVFLPARQFPLSSFHQCCTLLYSSLKLRNLSNWQRG